MTIAKRTPITIEGQDTMTVGELIDALSKFDRDAPIEIPVKQYNKYYPIGYLGLESVYPDPFNGVRIDVSLPPYMRTSINKSEKDQYDAEIKAKKERYS